MENHRIIFHLEGTIVNDKGCLFDGIINMLDELKQQNKYSGLVSFNGDESFFKTEAYRQVATYFDYIIFPNEETNFPPAMLLKYLLITNKKSKECLFIGHSQQDFLAAKGSGIRFGFAAWNTKETSFIQNNNCAVFESPYKILS
ncbi:MAG: HAD family hydrolase [Brevinema sp.]